MKRFKLGLLSGLMSVNFIAQAQIIGYIPPLDSYSNAIKLNNIDTIWSRGITGKGVTVGVIDQGFDINHPDLRTKVAASRNFITGNAVTWGSHGTAMASIIAGARNNAGMIGMAPDAVLLLAQVGPGGTSTSMNESALIRALDWTSAMGANVINISAGLTLSDSVRQSLRVNYTTGVWYAPSYSALFDYTKNLSSYALTTSRNSILVVSAGNQGLPYAGFPGQFASAVDTRTGKSLMDNRMIVVGAVDSTNTITSFSNRAGHICQSNFGSPVCLDRVLTRDFYVVAPGVNLTAAQSLPLSTLFAPTTSITGTSPAAAFVSGGMALMRQAWPQLKPEQLVQQVLNTTTDLGARGTDDVYGRGLVNFELATRPTGVLRIAQTTKPVNGDAGTGAVLANTNTSLSPGLATTLRANSLLTNVQTIDNIGRNYTADLSQAVRTRTAMYDFLSPYLSFAGYVPLKFNLENLELMTLVSPVGSALDFSESIGLAKLGLQIGSVNERNGFIGNYGQGALDLGSSSTAWQMFTVELPVARDLSFRMRYGQGFTRVQNNDLSMVEFLSGIRTDTYQFGLVKSNLFRSKDMLNFGIGTEPRIRSGQARITAVTEYNYRELEDGTVVGDPVVVRKNLDLQQVANNVLFTGYRTPLAQNGSLVASLSGNFTGYKFGVNFSWIQ